MPAKKVKKLVKEPIAKGKADEHVCLRDFLQKTALDASTQG